MVPSVKDAQWMEWITGLMRESPEQTCPAQELPASAFYCLLDEQPTHLVPTRLFLQEQNNADGKLFINPHCFFSGNGEIPAQLSDCAGLLENFALNADMVWVPDHGTGALAPFWLGPQFAELLSGLRPGDPTPANMPEHARRILTTAGVLVTLDTPARRRQQWSEHATRCRRQFRRKIVPIAGLLHCFQIAALRRYYRHLIRNGRIELGDDQSPRRYGAHNESVARFFHHQLTAAVSNIVGEPVKPSYVYTCCYLSGSELERHTDRPQCEFTVTFCLDFSPEPAGHTPWPIHVDTPNARVTIYQGIGDALLFCGREFEHYRYPLSNGFTSTSIFFHYVRQGFTGSLR